MQEVFLFLLSIIVGYFGGRALNNRHRAHALRHLSPLGVHNYRDPICCNRPDGHPEDDRELCGPCWSWHWKSAPNCTINHHYGDEGWRPGAAGTHEHLEQS